MATTAEIGLGLIGEAEEGSTEELAGDSNQGTFTFTGTGILDTGISFEELGVFEFHASGLLTTQIPLVAQGSFGLQGLGHLTSVGTARIRSGLCGHPTMALPDWKLVGAC